MLAPDWQEQVLLTTKDGIKMILSFEEEYYLNPETHFKRECGFSDAQYEEIEDFYWFCAKITAYRAGLELGNAYLGACCYKDLQEVLGNGGIGSVLSGYGPQMVEEALEEARSTIKTLTA